MAGSEETQALVAATLTQIYFSKQNAPIDSAKKIVDQYRDILALVKAPDDSLRSRISQSNGPGAGRRD